MMTIRMTAASPLMYTPERGATSAIRGESFRRLSDRPMYGERHPDVPGGACVCRGSSAPACERVPRGDLTVLEYIPTTGM